MAVNVVAIEPGLKAPQFKIQSGDDRQMYLEKIQSKLVIIFYESKDSIEQNRTLKNRITVLFNNIGELKTKTEVLSVIDCSSASWVTRNIWKKNLVENSRREKLIVYGDWDGRMLTDYGMEEGKSNFVIIDSKGIVRYFKSGKLDEMEIKNCLTLIRQLAEYM